MTFPTTITPSQANKETPIGEMFTALKPSALFGLDPANSSGVIFGLHGGPMLVDGVLTTIADQQVTCTVSATNYVESTRAGVASVNTSGFTAGRVPLYVVTTNASGVASYVDWRVWQDLPGVLGRTSVAVTTADVTLSAAQARSQIINVTGALTGNRSVIVPNGPQGWCVTNNTSGAFTLTVKTAAGSGIAVTQGKAAELIADGANVVLSNNDGTGGTVSSVDASGGVQTASGSPITTSGTIRGAHVRNAQTGTTYAVVAGDRGKHVTLSNASSIAATIAQAGTTGFEDGYYASLEAIGAGAVTLTPTTSTVNGAATLVLDSGMAALITSDGTNYRALVFDAAGTGVNAQAGTSYTYVSGDRTKLVTHSNASAIAGTLPQATGAFGIGWYTWVQNRGAGTLTITPTTSTIDGAATLALTTGQGAMVVSDGTNYFTMRGVGSASGASSMSGVVKETSYTRPADTNVYAAGDVICNSTSAPTILSFTGVGLANGGAFLLVSASVIDSIAQSTKPDIDLYLFRSSITMQNDNAAWAPSDADMEDLLCMVPFYGAAFATGSGNGTIEAVLDGAKLLACGGSTTTIYGVAVARNAYTPGSAEKFTFKLGILQLS